MLRDAVIRGDMEEMARLLNLGADINGVDKVRFMTHICIGE